MPYADLLLHHHSRRHLVQTFYSNDLPGVQELCSLWSEEKCSLADACWPQALGGILLALSSEGDIIYLSENVTQQLGLAQVRLPIASVGSSAQLMGPCYCSIWICYLPWHFDRWT